MSAQRFVVVLSRMDLLGDLSMSHTSEILGPFRDEERARRIRDRIERAADKYDEPEGVLSVWVSSIHPGTTSASDLLDYLYGSIEP